MDFKAKLVNIYKRHKVCQINYALERQNVIATLPDLQRRQVSTNPTQSSIFSAVFSAFSPEKKIKVLFLNQLYTEYTQVTSFSHFFIHNCTYS